MKLKKLMALGLAMALLAGTGTAVLADEEPEEIVFAFHMGKTVDLTPIEDALNEILIPKINVKVDLEGYSWSNYDTQIGLMQSGGEQLDVFGMCPNFSSFLTNNQLMCMDGLIDEYAAETKELIGEGFLKSTSKGNSLYGLPVYGAKTDSNHFVIRKDLVDELSLPVDKIVEATTFEEYQANMDVLSEIFATVAEAHPELVVVPTAQNPASLRLTEVPLVDKLSDSLGVLMPDDPTKVVNLYETDEFMTLCKYIYEWNQAGYILEDATTTQEAATTYLKNGRAFAYVDPAGSAEAKENDVFKSTNYEVVAKSLVQAFVDTNRVNNSAFGISVTSEHPEAAMKFLNEMYTNEAVMNILSYGVEGVNWEEKEGGWIGYPEGVNADNSTYDLGMSWYFGNGFLNKTWEGNAIEDVELQIEKNNSAKVSEAMGFIYDSTQVSTELAAITNVTAQYLPGLQCGTLNPEEVMPEFLAALESAGIDKVIAEKQAQYDAWLADNQ